MYEIALKISTKLLTSNFANIELALCKGVNVKVDAYSYYSKLSDFAKAKLNLLHDG